MRSTICIASSKSRARYTVSTGLELFAGKRMFRLRCRVPRPAARAAAGDDRSSPHARRSSWPTDRSRAPRACRPATSFAAAAPYSVGDSNSAPCAFNAASMRLVDRIDQYDAVFRRAASRVVECLRAHDFLGRSGRRSARLVDDRSDVARTDAEGWRAARVGGSYVRLRPGGHHEVRLPHQLVASAPW